MSDRRDERRSRVETLVQYLCSPACAGRAPGSPEDVAARTRIIAEFIAAGAAPGGDAGFVQDVPGCGANVLAEVAGAGPLAERTVVVAAQYDHLGKVAGGQAY